MPTIRSTEIYPCIVYVRGRWIDGRCLINPWGEPDKYHVEVSYADYTAGMTMQDKAAAFGENYLKAVPFPYAVVLIVPKDDENLQVLRGETVYI